MLITGLTALYVICALLLTLYAAGAFILLITYLRRRRRVVSQPPIAAWPTVAVQLPIYNEIYVVERLLDAVSRLDYPRDLLTVQVLDDSTDGTTSVIAERVTLLRRRGLNIEHVRRGSREGYKAGALAHGMALLNSEMVAVFDADFIPPRDFLRRTIPHLVADAGLGMVQARWGHLNTGENALTMGQTLALDGHFVVEQTARNRSGWLINFNGSGGVWRASAIRGAGGWQADTLTEDLDLSYRAQLDGWRFLYLNDLVVPGELPPQIAAYKQQQARWAKGGTQCLVRLIGAVWHSPRLKLSQRIMGTLHLCQYMVHPVLILLLLLTPPLLISRSLQNLSLGPLGIAGIAPPLIFIVSQQALYPDWRRRLLALPALLVLGTGISWSNARAVMSGFFSKQGEFKRTPKFRADWKHRAYALPVDKNILWEALLAAYSLWGVTVALRYAPSLALYLGIYSFSFALMALWGLRDHFDIKRSALHPVH